MMLFKTLQTRHAQWAVLEADLKARLSKSAYKHFRPGLQTLKVTLNNATTLPNDLVHSMYGSEGAFEEGSLVSDWGKMFSGLLK